LAAQKFIANINHDSVQIYKHRRKQAAVRLKERGLEDQTAVLMTEDLAEAFLSTTRTEVSWYPKCL
jgi:hypothetical protein